MDGYEEEPFKKSIFDGEPEIRLIESCDSDISGSENKISEQHQESDTFTSRHVKKRVGVINPSASKKKVRKTSCKNCSKTLFSKKEIWRHIRENEVCSESYSEKEVDRLRRSITKLKSSCQVSKDIIDNKDTQQLKSEEKCSVRKLKKRKEIEELQNEVDFQSCKICLKTFKSFRGFRNHLIQEPLCLTSYPVGLKKKIKNLSEEGKRPGVKRNSSPCAKKHTQTCKASPIPDPKVPQGNLNIPADEDSEKPYWSTVKQTSILGQCKINQTLESGSSKINHATSSVLTTLPVNTYLSPLTFSEEYCDLAESFVAMALSNDGESVEIKYLVHRSDITLEKLQDLLHHVLCLIETDLFTLLSDRTSPVQISPPEQLPLLRNRFTKEVLACGRQKPQLSTPLCSGPFKTQEMNFISDAMLDDIPFHQLLFNANLSISNTASVGVQFRPPSQSKICLAPIFSVNSDQHWRNFTKTFFTILVNWIGSKSALTEIIHRLPCGLTAKNQYFDSVKTECYNLVLEPRDVSVCDYCGEQFESYKYLFSEKNKYKHHVESHKLQCKECGESFPNATVRVFHERTHRKDHVVCTKEGCKWVGRSEKSFQTHIRIFHTHELCDLCGKEFANSQSLSLHIISYHLPKKPNNWYCEVCGKGYASKNILDKHVRRHFKENSLVNKWMHDSPNEYKYECTRHTNCKKYFKTEAQFKRHVRAFASREYPTKCATQYRPDIDPTKKEFIRTILDDGNPQISSVKRNLKKRSNAKMNPECNIDLEDGKGLSKFYPPEKTHQSKAISRSSCTPDPNPPSGNQSPERVRISPNIQSPDPPETNLSESMVNENPDSNFPHPGFLSVTWSDSVSKDTS